MNYREKEKIEFTIKMLEYKVEKNELLITTLDEIILEKKKIRDENKALKTTVNKLKKIVGGTDEDT